jgi:hypothetical protein
MNYTKLTASQSAMIRASYRQMLELSRSRRRAFVIRRDMVQALKALHWGNTAAGELADINTGAWS